LRALRNAHWAGGRFEVLREIGAGGMGIVFEAVDKELRSRVALKTLQRMDASSLLRFKREFRALQDIQHDNLVRLGELFEENGVWFFSMELVEGVDLFEHVCPEFPASSREITKSQTRDTSVLTKREAREARATFEEPPPPPAPSVPPVSGHTFIESRLRPTFRQLGRGLAALHAARKVHRDVKPSNLLVGPSGRLVILDFGVIADASDSQEDEIVGTAAYMAPEQALGGTIGPAADWYSVGAVLFLMLTGRTPFEGSVTGVLAAKTIGPPPRPSLFATGVPPDLDELCVDLLATHPDARPGADAVLRAFGVRSAPPSVESTRHPDDVFVGRARELDAIRRAFRATREGQPSLLLVSGVSGVGKTALVRRALREIEDGSPDAIVVAGRCYERESVPYKAVDEVMDGMSACLQAMDGVDALLPRDVHLLVRLFPVLRRVPAIAAAIDAGPEPAIADAQQMRARVFAALRTLLGGLARRRRLVLSIDDLQWADADSLALLAEILRGPDPPPLLLVGTVRLSADTSGARSVAELAARLSEEARRIDLAPLERREARVLIDRLLETEAHAPSVSPDAIAADAGGHPMFITALVRHRRLQGNAASVQLDDVLWARASALDPPARALLRVVAIAGTPIRQDVAAQVAGLEAGELARAAGVLRAAQLVRTDGVHAKDTIEPYHDRVRETVIARASDEEVTAGHRGLAVALEAHGADPETLGDHWRGAGDGARAFDHYLTAAGYAAEVLAFEHAARLYASALELLPEGDARRPELHTRRGDALANAGRGREASEAYAAAVTDPRSLAGIDLRRRACEQLLRSGHFDAGIKMTRALLAELGLSYPRTPTHALASLLFRRAQIQLRGFHFRERAAASVPAIELARIDACWAATIGLGMTDLVRGNDFQTRHLLLALRAGEPYRVAKALAVEAGYLSTVGVPGLRDTERVVALAKEVAARDGHPHAVGLAMLFDGYRAFLIGAFAETRSIMEAAEHHLRERCTGVAWELTNAQLLCAWALGFSGEIDVLAARLPEYDREARERGDLFAIANLRNGLPFIHRIARGDVDGARRDLDEVMGDWSVDGFHLQHYYAMHARTDIELYAGNAAAAQEYMDRDWPGMRASLLERVQLVKLNALHVRARCALASAALRQGSERKAFLDVARECARRIERDKLGWSTPLADLVRAAERGLVGDDAAKVTKLRSAVSGFTAAGMRLHAASAERRLGEAIGGEEGRGHVAAADAWFAAKGVKSPERLVAAVAPGFAE
jgi:serine/threonine protein kinase